MNSYQRERLQKIEELRELEIEVYPHHYSTTLTLEQFNRSYAYMVEKSLEHETMAIERLAGRVLAIRRMGKVIFLDIASQAIRTQCYIKIERFNEQQMAVIDRLALGDHLGVEGHPFVTKKNELALYTSALTLLSKGTALLAEKYHGISDPELIYQQRELAMLSDQRLTRNLILRSQVISYLRRFLEAKGFLECETPVLQPIYGGASARPFTTHHHADNRQMFLKISPELYLKRLLVGGLERVFEITKCFRNEGIDRTHQPEFTMLEWYQAYSDYREQLVVFEELVSGLVEKIFGSRIISYQGRQLNFERPWRRLTVYQGVQQYAGIDPATASDAQLLFTLHQREPHAQFNGRGRLIMRLFEVYAEPELWEPTFVMDHPIDVSPLTKVHRDHPELVERFEPFIAGMEVGNAYSELNDPMEQRRRFEEQQREREFDGEIPPLDERFLSAMDLGMPPAGGVGLGIDRLMMILTDSRSIRDIMAFPG